ncbi:MAG: AzlD domain-containing protein [Clostridia bacterium]|nr:AzlD domain-containing protein [Clostridia bacterium]
MSSVNLIILGMMIVTYLPRVVPFFMVDHERLPNKVKQFLEYIPYTALGVLVLPGTLTAVPEHLTASVIGIIFTVAYSYFKGGIIISVIGTIGIVYLLLLTGIF